MSKAIPAKSNVSNHNSRNKTTNVRVGLSRSKSANPGRLPQRQKNDMQKINTEPRSLEESGYYFNKDGKLVSIDGDRPFEFNVSTNNEVNCKRYHAIGRLVDNHVYSILENNFHLRRIPIPRHADAAEPTGFFFANDDILTADYLMIIIHGMGVVRAGQWSRKLIINESLEVGSQFDYIQRALIKKFAVIVTNTNLNTDESSTSIFNKPRPIRGSGSAEEHACHVWENYVRQSPARHICIMAHSYGGAVMLELATRYTSEFDKRVFAVALTDSPMKGYTKHCNTNVLRMLQKRTINWIADGSRVDTQLNSRDYGQTRSAGHMLHEWTSFTAYQSIFKFFEEERQKLERAKR